MKKTYAVSMQTFGGCFSEKIADAFLRSKIKNIELTLSAILDGTPEAKDSRSRLRDFHKRGKIRIASIHIPYGPHVEPACTDEEKRKKISEALIRMLEENAEFAAPEMTLHAGSEPTAPEERKRKIGQACRTIEELLPVAERLHSRINVEYLPRTCPGNCAEELLEIAEYFNSPLVGINLDMNHVMMRWRELPEIIRMLSPWLNACHISDFDGQDEQHWFPGRGIIDWYAVMNEVNALPHDILLIFEYLSSLGGRRPSTDRIYMLKEAEYAAFFLENIERFHALNREMERFTIPGNSI